MAVESAYDTYLPTLGIEGWLSNPQALVEKMFFYYVASYGKQSNMFRGYVYSLLDSVKKGSDPYEIRNNIVQDLSSLYESHFPREDINVTVTASEVLEDAIVNLYIDVTLTKDNVKYSLKETLEIKDSNINNYQTVLNRLKSDVIE